LSDPFAGMDAAARSAKILNEAYPIPVDAAAQIIRAQIAMDVADFSDTEPSWISCVAHDCGHENLQMCANFFVEHLANQRQALVALEPKVAEREKLLDLIREMYDCEEDSVVAARDVLRAAGRIFDD